MPIKSNAIRCNFCDHVLRSTHVHDYRTHSCEAMRIAYKDYDPLAGIEEMYKPLYGAGPYWPSISVDGGLEYLRRGYNKPTDYTELSEYEEASNNHEDTKT